MRQTVTLAFCLLLIGVGSWGLYEWLVLGGRGVIFKAGVDGFSVAESGALMTPKRPEDPGQPNRSTIGG
jgi:hypothetical protein